MRILQVVHGFPPYSNAGAEKYTYSLCRELTKRHEVHVIFPISGKTYLHINSYSSDGLYLHELSAAKRSGNWLKGFVMALRSESTFVDREVEVVFRKFIQDLNPDIVHFQHLLYMSASLINITGELKIPSVLTLHDFWFLCPVVQLFQYTGQVCNGPEPSTCKQCWVTKRSQSLATVLSQYNVPMWFANSVFKSTLRAVNTSERFRERENYMKALLLKVNKIIAPSRFLRETFVTHGVPKDKIIHTEHGYDTNVFSGYRKQSQHDKVVFGFVGRVVRVKGVHTLIDAFIRVPEEKAELRIYGGYDAKSPYVRHMIDKTAHKQNIKFMGQADDISTAYSQIDVLVFPSIWYENCPLVLAERQLTRTPVIVSNLGAIPEFVVAGEDGLLFEPGNSDDLYEKIMLIVEKPELIQKFADNISKYPKGMHQQAVEIEAIYAQCMKESSANAS